MERHDVELIEKYISTDNTLRKLYEEHLDLERKLDGLNRKAYLTPGEETEKKILKKYKLRGRDQIENILRKYRGVE